MGLNKAEIPNSIPLKDRVRASIVEGRISGLNTREFISALDRYIGAPDADIGVTRTSLFPDRPDHAHVFSRYNNSPDGEGVVSFHFPGAGGQWDEYRYGPHPDGYAGAALRGGVQKAIISDWSYADPQPTVKPSKRGIYDQVNDVVDAIKASGATKVYLSGRSYGALVVLYSVPEVQKLGVEIVGIDLKVPAISYPKSNALIAESLKNIPLLIIRGDNDRNTNTTTTNDLFSQIQAPKLLVTLTDITTKDHFDHDLETPELMRATAAISQAFIRTILKARSAK